MPVTPEGAAQALMARLVGETEALTERMTEIRGRLPGVARLLRTRYGVARVILFGSLAWGQFHAASDVDIAVTGLTLEQLGQAMADASEMAGTLVELFRLEALPAGFRERILCEGLEIG